MIYLKLSFEVFATVSSIDFISYLSTILVVSQRLSKRREDERNDEAELTRTRLKITTTSGQTNRKLKAHSRISENDRKAERSRLLDLAMDWNCVNIAKEFVFKNSLTNIMVIIFIDLIS